MNPTTYRFTPISDLKLPAGVKLPAGITEDVLRLRHEEMRIADERWRGMRAFGTDHDALRGHVSEYIEATYAFQRARYGKIMMRLSVAAILR
jgi:hypothetical protein